MKAFLVTVSSLCLCAILLCFFAYAAGNFPFVPRVYDMPKPTQSQQVVMQTPSIELDPLCSPCVERMVLLIDTVQEWETETTQLASVPDSQQVELEMEEECSPCEENLKRLKEAMERWERERSAQVAPVSPSDPPGITKPTPFPPSVADIEN